MCLGGSRCVVVGFHWGFDAPPKRGAMLRSRNARTGRFAEFAKQFAARGKKYQLGPGVFCWFSLRLFSARRI